MTIRDTAIANVRYVLSNLNTRLKSLETTSLRTQSGTAITVLKTDPNKMVVINTSSGTGVVTVTVNNTTAWTAGQRCDFLWNGSTTAVTFVGNSGATLTGTPGLKLRARYSAASLIALGSGIYVLVGDLSA